MRRHRRHPCPDRRAGRKPRAGFMIMFATIEDRPARSRPASKSTLVVYMPGSNYDETAGRLIAAGFAGETPCAIISKATTREQRIFRTTVTELSGAAELASPTLLVVGEVVRLADGRLVEEAAHLQQQELGSAIEQSVTRERELLA